MDPRIIELYLSKVPAVICTAGSYIAAKNEEARKQLSSVSEGDLLFDRMSPENILKFDANFASSRSGNVFSFTVSCSGGARHAVALFDSICSKRFAAVMFYKNAPDIDEIFSDIDQEPAFDLMMKFASVMLGIPDERFEPDDKRGLIDLRNSTKALLERLSDRGIVASYSENREMELSCGMPEDIPLGSYLQMIMLMLYVTDSIGGCKDTEVKLCKFGGDAEVRVSTAVSPSLCFFNGIDELAHTLPSVGTYLYVCDEKLRKYFKQYMD